jgi:DNA-binding NarL/FixJ family response regulator
MMPDPARTPPIDTVAICHREQLVAAATAALIEDRGITRHTITVNSMAHLLSRLGPTVEVVVVFGGVGEDVPDLLEAMHHRGLTTPVLVVSASIDAADAAAVVEAGAAGVVYAWCDPEELHGSILDARAGQVVIPRAHRGEILDALRRRRTERIEARRVLARLSALDIRILQGLCDGMTVARIAERLLLSPHTVRGHVRAIGRSIGGNGQLGIAATGRHLLAAARLPMSGGTPAPLRVASTTVPREEPAAIRAR